MPGAQTIFKIVNSADWYTEKMPERLGAPSARATCAPLETARRAICWITRSGELVCREPRQSAISSSVLNTAAPSSCATSVGARDNATNARKCAVWR